VEPEVICQRIEFQKKKVDDR